MTPALTAMLDAIILREGPFSHLSADRGGATNWGITQSTLTAWRGHPVTIEDVKALTQAEARTIYEALYYVRPGFAALPDSLQPLLLDFAVNSGPAIAIRALQESLKLTADGILGPKTLAAAFAASPHSLINAIVGWRIMMLARLVRRDPTQLVFLSGWLWRALSFLS